MVGLFSLYGYTEQAPRDLFYLNKFLIYVGFIGYANYLLLCLMITLYTGTF